MSSFKMGHFCDMFNWRMTEGYAYWPLWARQTGSMLQLIPILLIPAVGLIQCIRYLSSGPSDLFDVGITSYESMRFCSLLLSIYFSEDQITLPAGFQDVPHTKPIGFSDSVEDVT